MHQIVSEYIHNKFNQLVVKHGFRIESEINEDGYYQIIYTSDWLTIEIEEYRTELYVYLYKPNGRNEAINMYNILEFKALFSTEPSDSNYFHEVKDEIERYKKQIDHITLTIINNYKLISDFFDDHDFHSNYIEFEKYRKKQYPQYYKTN